MTTYDDNERLRMLNGVYAQCSESCTSDCGHCKGRRFGPYTLTADERDTVERRELYAAAAKAAIVPSPAAVAATERAHRKTQPLAQLSSQVSGEDACEYEGKYLPHHSDDLFKVWTGAPQPHLWCGFHLSAIGVKNLCASSR